MRAGDDRDRPREAPAVAVKHRQRPQIDRMLAPCAQVTTLPTAEQMRAAVVIDDALRIAGGAGGVIERDRVPFVVRHRPGEVGIAFARRTPRIRSRRAARRRRNIPDRRSRSPAASPWRSASASFITLENSRSMMTTLASAWSSEKAMIGGVEPRVERVEHALRHRHAVVALEHRRRVGEHHRRPCRRA